MTDVVNEIPAPRFVTTEGRSETVKLDWPVEYNGKVYDTITVRRLTVGELADWTKSLNDMTKEEKDSASMPIFDAPVEVMRALDADDDSKLEAVAERFMPARFKADRA